MNPDAHISLATDCNNFDQNAFVRIGIQFNSRGNFQWKDNLYLTGGVLGPLPPTGWTQQLITGSNQIDAIALLSQNTDTSLSEHNHRLKTEEKHLSFLDSLSLSRQSHVIHIVAHFWVLVARCFMDANCAWCTNTKNNSMVTGTCVPIEQVNESMVCITGRKNAMMPSIRRVNSAPNDHLKGLKLWLVLEYKHAHVITPIFRFSAYFHGQRMKIKVCMAAFRYPSQCLPWFTDKRRDRCGVCGVSDHRRLSRGERPCISVAPPFN